MRVPAVIICEENHYWWMCSLIFRCIDLCAMVLQMKMQDLLLTNHVHSSKKDDSVTPDDADDVTAAEPLNGAGPSQDSPSSETEEGMMSSRHKSSGISPAPAPAAATTHEELLLAATGQPLLRIPAVGLMFADTLYGAPTLLPELVNRWGAVHKILIILTVRQVSTILP